MNQKNQKATQHRREFIKTITAAAAVTALGRSTSSFAQEQTTAVPGIVHIEDLNLQYMLQDWGTPHAKQSVTGSPLSIGTRKFINGLGTHADSELNINLHGHAQSFSSWVGIDSDVNGKLGSVIFRFFVDGKLAAISPVMRGGGDPIQMTVDLTGAQKMQLLASRSTPDISWDHADWAEAAITMIPGATKMPESQWPENWTDVPKIFSNDGPEPAFHGPQVVGCTPGYPFLFKVPLTGVGKITITADDLPSGLIFSTDGIISGVAPPAGEYVVELVAENPSGRATRKLKIVAGEHMLAQTPPMGWNSWNVWAASINAEKMRQAADLMISTGLAAKGYAYVNLDDTWEADRAADGTITTNQKFGDMKSLADYIHAKGLKFGIYSSPGAKTCGNYTGSYQHEQRDAQTYAEWGVDYLKYDYCSYAWVAPKNPTVGDYIKPYAVMRTALDNVKRDIVYSLCQYGMGYVWNWAAYPPVNGNLWRISTDISDNWSSLMFNGFITDGTLAYHAGPGHWNDPDMLIVGQLGWGSNIHSTGLRPMEQLTHITLWCMAAAPLLIGCDLSALDPFTLSLLTNTEVIDIDQDPLGKQAGPILTDSAAMTQVWARQLSDGTFAVALFNLGPTAQKISFNWSDLTDTIDPDSNQKALSGSQPVRDLWLRKNMGSWPDGFSATVARHGAVMVKVGKPG